MFEFKTCQYTIIQLLNILFEIFKLNAKKNRKHLFFNVRQKMLHKIFYCNLNLKLCDIFVEK